MGVYQHAACSPLPKETSQCTCQVTGGQTFSTIVRISTAYTIYLRLSSCFYPQPSRLYCSSLYLGLPHVCLRPLDDVLRAAARPIGGVPKFSHIGEFM